MTAYGPPLESSRSWVTVVGVAALMLFADRVAR